MPEVARWRFVPVDSCLDYKAYTCEFVHNLTSAQHSALSEELIALGQTHEERMGVVYVNGPWGFFVIPRPGFPVLKVSFYHDTPITEINEMCDRICAVFDSVNMVNYLGALHE